MIFQTELFFSLPYPHLPIHWNKPKMAKEKKTESGNIQANEVAMLGADALDLIYNRTQRWLYVN